MQIIFKSRLLHLFLLLVFVSRATSSYELKIKIGALYNKDTASLKNILESVFTDEFPREIYVSRRDFKLELVPLRVDGKDLLSKEIAESLASVLAIIDLACKNEKAFALSSLLQVPLVKVDAIEDETSHKYALSVRPSYRVISDALFDVASFYSFNRVAVVYDARKSRQASFFYAKIRKWPKFNAEMMPELPLDDQHKLRVALTALLKSHIKQVILFADQKDLAMIMNEALYVGINDKDLKWLASDLEVAGENKTYPSILGMVGLSLHLGNKDAAKDLKRRAQKAVDDGALEYSLAMYSAVRDAAIVVGKGMKNILAKKNKRNQIIGFSTNLSCPLQSSNGNGLGKTILKELKEVSFDNGFTGNVAFDTKTGERKINDGMDILNVLPHDVQKVQYCWGTVQYTCKLFI